MTCAAFELGRRAEIPAESRCHNLADQVAHDIYMLRPDHETPGTFDGAKYLGKNRSAAGVECHDSGCRMVLKRHLTSFHELIWYITILQEITNRDVRTGSLPGR